MVGDGRVRIVVDDTACLQPEVADNLGITVVPVEVEVDDNAVTTSAPGPLPLCAAYARALEQSSGRLSDDGDSVDAGVVALHVGKNLSSTWSNGVSAASVLENVEVINTNTVGAGVGAAAIAAAKAARNSASLEECVAAAQDVLDRYMLWLYAPSLDSLHRGGRISTGQAMLAAVLATKPIFGIAHGSLAPVAKCRTSAKVLERLVQLAVSQVERCDCETVAPHVLIHHADDGSTVELLHSMLVDALPDNTKFRILDLPPSLRTHAGSGAIALGVISSENPQDSQASSADGDSNDASDDGGTSTAVNDVLHLRNALKNVKLGRGSVVNRKTVTDEDGAPLFTTVAAKLPSWSANRQAALEKADHFAKAIADLARRDHSDPEGARFGEDTARSSGNTGDEQTTRNADTALDDGNAPVVNNDAAASKDPSSTVFRQDSDFGKDTSE